MPSQKIILQGVTKDNHLTSVKQILAIQNPRPTGVTELGRMLLEYIELPDD